MIENTKDKSIKVDIINQPRRHHSGCLRPHFRQIGGELLMILHIDEVRRNWPENFRKSNT
jgi:hypothetical protein